MNALPTSLLLLIVVVLKLAERVKVELTLDDCDTTSSSVLVLIFSIELVTPPTIPAIIADMTMMSMNLASVSP